MTNRMHIRALVAVLAAIVLTATACTSDNDTPAPATSPTATVAGTAPPATTAAPTETPATTPTATATAIPAEAIPGTCAHAFPAGLSLGQEVDEKFVCVETPAPHDTVTATAGATTTVRGWVAGAFEQNVVVQVADDDGNVLAMAPTTATGIELGLFAAQWVVELTLDADPATDGGTVRAYTSSPRDGSIETEAEIPVAFAR